MRIAISIIAVIGVVLIFFGIVFTSAILTGNAVGGDPADIQILGTISFFVLLIGVALFLCAYQLDNILDSIENLKTNLHKE